MKKSLVGLCVLVITAASSTAAQPAPTAPLHLPRRRSRYVRRNGAWKLGSLSFTRLMGR